MASPSMLPLGKNERAKEKRVMSILDIMLYTVQLRMSTYRHFILRKPPKMQLIGSRALVLYSAKL